MEWMNEVSEFICEYFKSTSTRAVTRVYGNNAGSAYALRKRAHFVVRAFKEVKAAYARKQFFVGKSRADFFNNVVCTSVGTAVEDDKTIFSIKNEALFVRVIIWC